MDVLCSDAMQAKKAASHALHKNCCQYSSASQQMEPFQAAPLSQCHGLHPSQDDQPFTGEPLPTIEPRTSTPII
jgi:hypothetical protein